jgi:hypothetical protein
MEVNSGDTPKEASTEAANGKDAADGKDSASLLDKDASEDAELYKTTDSTLMESEAADGKDSSSSLSKDVDEDPKLYETAVSTPMELEDLSSWLSVEAQDDSTLFSKTSLTPLQSEEYENSEYVAHSFNNLNELECESRVVTQTQLAAAAEEMSAEVVEEGSMLASVIYQKNVTP